MKQKSKQYASEETRKVILKSKKHNLKIKAEISTMENKKWRKDKFRTLNS